MPANTPEASGRKGRARLIVIVLVLLLVGGRRLRHVLDDQHRSRLLPADRRARSKLEGPVRPRRRHARRLRHPADLRRHSTTTCSSRRATCRRRTASTRWTSGGTSTAGRLSEMFGAGQVETDTFLRTLGWRRVAEQEYDPSCRPQTQELPAGLRRRASTPTSRTTRGDAAVAGVRRPRPRPNRLHAREVDAGRLGGLAQGDGLGPARQHAGRDRPRADGQPAARGEQIAELYPAYPYDRHQPIVDQGGGRSRAFEQDGRDGEAATPAAGTAPGQPRPSQRVAAATAVAAQPRSRSRRLLGAERQRHRLQLLGGLRRLHRRPASRCSPTTRTWRRSCRGIWYQMGLHCRTVTERLPVRRHAASPSPGCPGVVIGHNQHIAWGFTNLGAGRHRPLPGEGHRRRYLYDGKQVPLDRPARRPSRSPAASRRDDHGARDQQRPAALRRRHELRQGRRRRAAVPATRPRPRRRLRGRAARGPRCSPAAPPDAVFELDRATDWTGLPRRGHGLRRALAEPRLRRHRRQHRLPGAGLDPDPRKGGDGATTPRPAGTPRTTGRKDYDPVRRSCPTSTTRSGATSSPPTRPSSTPRSTRTC